MPTENSELVPGKLFVQTNENEEPIELKAIDIDIGETQEEKYTEQASKGYTGQGTITVDVKLTGKIKKMLGIQKITRKRFIKLLMGCRVQRNDAQEIAKIINRSGIEYSPIVVQTVIEWLIKENV